MAGTHHHHNITAKELPQDLIMFHILPRLPAKTVVGFRRVCKQWHVFLKTRMFFDMHHHHLITNNHHQNDHKLLLTLVTTPCMLFSINCEALDQGITTLTVPFKARDGPYKDMSILASCNGMICIGMTKRIYADEYTNLFFWNPLTHEYKTLSKTNSHGECYEANWIRRDDGTKMYYNSIEDDYKLLRVTKSCNVYMYSLKSDSWRKMESTENSRSYWNFLRSMPSVLLDDKVYFLNQRLRQVWIIKFDTKTEKFTKIANPSFGKEKPACWEHWRFSVERGCIHLYFRNTDDGRIHVFRMNGDGDWTQVETYLVKPLHSYHLSPLHLMRNGNWLMHWGCYIYDVDLKKYINGDTKDSLYKVGTCNCIAEKVEYIETFVSPNQYM